jgi:molybdate transport system substrate-binding protein
MKYRPRSGRVSTLWTFILGGSLAVVVLVALLRLGGPKPEGSRNTLKIYCAAGLRFPLEAVAKQYQEEYGITIDPQYGGSNTLLNQLEIDKFSQADLYLAADDLYTDAAREKGLAAEVLPIAYQRPVFAVRRGNPKNIASFEDLLSDEVVVAIPDPDHAAAGRTARERLSSVQVGDTNRWAQLERHAIEGKRGVFKPTINDVASDIKLGSVDAGIVWDSTVAMPAYRDELEALTLPELDGEPSLVSVCVLNSSRRPTAALKFARYLTARDRGLPLFEEYGLQPVEGDQWAERPEITFFCGAVARRAVEQVIAGFEQREDCVVNTIYDGCGILTSRMKTIEGQSQAQGFPDVYMACDVYYLDNVKQWFQEAADMSDTEIVIAVPKGSTKVTGLQDLVKPGIRVAVGEPDLCTIGALTRRLLAKEGLYDALKEKQQQEGEVVVEKSSSALLVPDVVTGHVDAAVAYITDVKANLETVDVVRIDSALNLAIQPLSIARTSNHKHLVRRLFRRIAESPDAFENAGFHFRWQDPSATDPTKPTESNLP